MRCETKWLTAVGAACLILFAAGAVLAQSTTSTETRSFEIVSVDGNKVVARDAEGAREYTVPEDFRFDVGGRKLSVRELKPGMKGAATITTTTTTKPVHVTEVRNGEVIQVEASSVIVRGEKGYHMYNQGDVDRRNVQIFREGKAVKLSDLHAGDRLTATIVTEGPPQVLTERQVQASLATGAAATASSGAGKGTAPAAAVSTSGTSGTASSAPQVEGATATRELPATASRLPLVGLIGVISLALAVVVALTSRRPRRR